MQYWSYPSRYSFFPDSELFFPIGSWDAYLKRGKRLFIAVKAVSKNQTIHVWGAAILMKNGRLFPPAMTIHLAKLLFAPIGVNKFECSVKMNGGYLTAIDFLGFGGEGERKGKILRINIRNE